jgi:hypothetical protein
MVGLIITILVFACILLYHQLKDSKYHQNLTEQRHQKELENVKEEEINKIVFLQFGNYIQNAFSEQQRFHIIDFKARLKKDFPLYISPRQWGDLYPDLFLASLIKEVGTEVFLGQIFEHNQ